MVGPSRTEMERRAASRPLQLGFVALVGGSGGLVAFTVGGSPAQIGGGLVAGLALGVALLAFLLRLRREL